MGRGVYSVAFPLIATVTGCAKRVVSDKPWGPVKSLAIYMMKVPGKTFKARLAKISASPQFRVTAVYLGLGLLWIYLSDLVLYSLFDSATALTLAQHIKGWLFVLFTGGVLYLVVRYYFNSLVQSRDRLSENHEHLLESWVQLMDMRQLETEGHTYRVAAMVLELARLSGIRDAEALEAIRRGAVMHDIGKIGLPESFFLRSGRLKPEEIQILHTHPYISYNILSRFDFLKGSLDIPYCYSERWDGGGYPRGLQGAAIPLAARLFSVVHVWDALVHPKTYKQAWSEEDALEYLQEQAGSMFDPVAVRLFMQHYQELRQLAARETGQAKAAETVV